MSRFSSRVLFALALAGTLALDAGPALGADGHQNQAAVDLAYEGKERFEAGDYATALERFERARALAGSPVFDLYIARCLKALGRWREAITAYEQAERHEVEPSNVSFKQAQENAARERSDLQAKIPKLSVVAPQAGPAPDMVLQIDGEPAPWPARDLPLDPGKHVLSATLGSETYDDVVTLAAGDTRVIELSFGRGEASRDDTSLAAPSGEKSAGRGLSPLAWTAFGVGAAGLIVGGVTGTVAIVNTASLKDHCAANPCPDGVPQDDDYESLKSTTGDLATAATVGFIVAGVGAILGVTFALTLNKTEKGSARTTLDVRPAGAGLLLSGSF